MNTKLMSENMKGLIGAAFLRKRMILTLLFLIFIAGIYAYKAIPKESDPDINIPIIYVSLHLEGISPEDSERLLIRPVEEELTAIEGVKEIRSHGYQGGGSVTLEFNAGFDVDQAILDVREGVDKAKSKLPQEADEPTVNEVNLSLFPILVVTITGDIPERTMQKMAERLQSQLESIPSVLEARISGEREEQVEIIIDPVKVESYNLNASEIIAFFQRSDVLVAAGNLDTGAGRFAIKVPGLIKGLGDILNMPVKVSGDAVTRVRDIAIVRRNFKDPEQFARLNGEQSVAIEIVKRTGENIIETIDRVKETVDAEKANWPEGVTLTYTQDQSNHIKEMLEDLENNVISAVVLVMIVCVAALGLTSSLLIGVAIPGSFLMGILILYLMGFTVNVVVLFGLILSVGILVDGTIVVVEYAERRMSEGLEKAAAYLEASRMMVWPVISSTLTIIAAFLPLLFWPGIVGEFMKYLPITMIAILGASITMAMIFVPVLGSLLGQTNHVKKADDSDYKKAKGFTGAYVRLLDRWLHYPGRVILGAIALLIIVQFAYGKFGHGVSFFPDIEPDIAVVDVHARGNLSIYEQDQLVRRVEDIILNVKGIKAVYTRTGAGGRDASEDTIGRIQIEFADWQERPRASVIMDEIREKTKAIAGINVVVQQQQAGPKGAKAIEIELSSYEPEALPEMIAFVRRGFEEVGGFIDVEDTLPLPGIEWELQFDRAQAAKFGVDLNTVGQYVRMITNGLKITEYRPDDSKEEIDVVARHGFEKRSLDQLDHVRVETAAGSVPISNFVTREAKQKVSEIHRTDQIRVMEISANVEKGLNSTAQLQKLEQWFKDNQNEWNKKVNYKFKGDDEEQKEAQAFLSKAFIVSLFLIAIIMLTQFDSFFNMIVILSAIVMSTVGVFLGLMMTGRPFGIVMTGIGVISLAGMIVSNNIILIDTFNHWMKEVQKGAITVREAILKTGSERLRPVFLTALTTALGLLPIMFHMNINFIDRDVTIDAPSTQWWIDISNAIGFGIFFATPLTLIVTPCALMWRENRKAKKNVDKKRPLVV